MRGGTLDHYMLLEILKDLSLEDHQPFINSILKQKFNVNIPELTQNQKKITEDYF